MSLRIAIPVLCVALAASGATRAADDPDTEVARKHFAKGRHFYDVEDYPAALAEFEAARKVKPLPALDFNIGRCDDRLERYPEAIAAYERYVSSTPPPTDAAEVRERIKVLRGRLPAPEPAKPSPREAAKRPPSSQAAPPSAEVVKPAPLLAPVESSAPAAAVERKSNKKTLAIVLGVVGGALLVGGAVALAVVLQPTSTSYTPSTLGTWKGTP
jgi:tetratricopeptide (TPR) repeat protein